jgi:hypothetical protein
MAMQDPPTLDPVSPSMQHVLDAMLEGASAPPEALGELTDDERAELASLARTANLTALTLHLPDPNPDAVARALARAEREMERRTPNSSPPADAGTYQEAAQPRRSWLDRFLKRGG